MDLNKLTVLYIVLLFIQGYMVYINEDMNCSIGLKKEEIKPYNYDEFLPFAKIETKPIEITPIKEFWYYLLVMGIYLPLIYLFQKLFDWRL